MGFECEALGRLWVLRLRWMSVDVDVVVLMCMRMVIVPLPAESAADGRASIIGWLGLGRC
jgi:hypothetical protein